MGAQLKYLAGYALDLQQQIQRMFDDDTLQNYLDKKYPEQHTVGSD